MMSEVPLVITIKCLNCKEKYDYPETSSNSHKCPFCRISHEDHYNCKDINAKNVSRDVYDMLAYGSVTLTVGDKQLEGRIIFINRNGKFKIMTGQYETWDVHPSLIKDHKVTITTYVRRQIFSDTETHVQKVKVQ
jgi:hypothetical protein